MTTRFNHYLVYRTAAVMLAALLPSMGAQAAEKVSGTLTGSIGGDALSLQGTCSRDDKVFEFWSDGTDFAVNNDSNGDGVYLNIMIQSLGSRTMAMLRYNRGKKTIYNGLFEFEEFDGYTLAVATSMGRNSVPAEFSVDCQ